VAGALACGVDVDAIEEQDVKMANQGIAMLCVTHEMGFAKAAADGVILMDQGRIVEQNAPEESFNHPKSERSRDFLSKILGH
jgi:general L-amino acid transport system ATP-binding protein